MKITSIKRYHERDEYGNFVDEPCLGWFFKSYCHNIYDCNKCIINKLTPKIEGWKV